MSNAIAVGIASCVSLNVHKCASLSAVWYVWMCICTCMLWVIYSYHQVYIQSHSSSTTVWYILYLSFFLFFSLFLIHLLSIVAAVCWRHITFHLLMRCVPFWVDKQWNNLLWTFYLCDWKQNDKFSTVPGVDAICFESRMQWLFPNASRSKCNVKHVILAFWLEPDRIVNTIHIALPSIWPQF